MSIRINGELEIDEDRGVIYFHPSDAQHPLCGVTLLRLSGFPTPTPAYKQIDARIAFADWSDDERTHGPQSGREEAG